MPTPSVIATLITLSGKRCLINHPRWSASRGKANSYVCPRGKESGRAWVLLDRESLNAIIDRPSHELTFQTNQEGGAGGSFAGTTTFGPLFIINSWKLDLTEEDDGKAVHLVELGDVRYLAERYSALFDVEPQSSWQSLVTQLWALLPSDMGSAPTLPYTPIGTPKEFDCIFANKSAWESLHIILDKWSMTTAINPVSSAGASKFRIVRIGGVQTLTGLPDPPYHTHENQDTTTTKVARTIRVYFPDDTTVNVPSGVTGASAGTIKPIWDDFRKFEPAQKTARATELADAYTIAAMTPRSHKLYPSILPQVRPGERVREVLYRHFGIGDGTITEYKTGPDALGQPHTCAPGKILFKMLDDRTRETAPDGLYFGRANVVIQDILVAVPHDRGDEVEVIFGDRLWLGAVKDCEGIAEWRDAEQKYVVEECQSRAGLIQFVILQDRDPHTPDQDVLASVVHAHGTENDVIPPPTGGQQPFTVRFPALSFPRALEGAFGTAIHNVDWDNTTDNSTMRYDVVFCDQMALTIIAQAPAKICPADYLVGITLQQVNTFYGFGQTPTNVTFGTNLFALAAKENTPLWCEWNEKDERWIIVQVEHQAIDLVETIRKDPQGCNIQVGVRKFAVMTCETEVRWRTDIQLTQYDVVDEVHSGDCEILAEKVSICAFPGSGTPVADQIQLVTKDVVTAASVEHVEGSGSGQDGDPNPGSCKIVLTRNRVCVLAGSGAATPTEIVFSPVLVLEDVYVDGLCVKGDATVIYVPCVDESAVVTLFCGVECPEEGSGSGQ